MIFLTDCENVVSQAINNALTKEFGSEKTGVVYKSMKSSFVIGIGILVIGFLFSWIGWKTFQTEVAVGIGMVIQLLGIITFELMQSRCEISNKLITKRKFYAVGSWLICPFCALFSSNTILSLYPRSYSYWIGLLFLMFI